MEYFNEINKVYPDWIYDKTLFTKTSNGLSNINYCVQNNTEFSCGPTKVLLRIYGVNWNPIDYVKTLKITKEGFGAKILHSFKEGRIEEWLEGSDINHSMINIPLIIKIAQELRRFHDTLHMSHMDLHFKNIILSPDLNKVNFIDFEYSGDLDREFDIANFFNEWLHDYDSKEWYTCNLNLFPSMTHINLFYEHYNGLDPIVNIETIFTRFDDVNNYWIEWSKSYPNDDYRLYEYNRRKLLGHDFLNMVKHNK